MKSAIIVRLNAIVFLAAATVAAQSSTVNVQVGNQIDKTVGVNGRLQVAMSTSFQLANYSYTYFQATPAAPPNLTALDPFHTRVQVTASGIPLTAADTWDFTTLNTMFSPIQATGDHSPEFQIGQAPAYLSDGSGDILSNSTGILPAALSAFAQMAANMVSYYNTGGFTDAGTHYQSPTPYPVTWWGIFNEPDYNGVTAAEYVTLYNAVVPAMAQADPNIKFVAVELGGAPGSYMPLFVNGVTAPVDVVAKHFYSSCNQKDIDQTVFVTIPGFVSQVQTMYQYMADNPALANVPIWITENNVNADYSDGGISNCNRPLPYVLDKRGNSPFFGAWRSLVFEQLGEAGVQALYQWSFGSDQQYGETDGSGNPQFSYWVDYYLSHWLPSPPGQDILQTTTSGCCNIATLKTWIGGGGLVYDTQTLAARNVDGSVVVLMSNYAINATYDDNGPGISRTFALDLSALGSFSTATLVTLDAATPAATGPVPQSLTPAAQMQVTLPGYGAALLRLSNAQPVVTAAGVANAASLTAGAVAPGEIVSIFGSALGPAAGANGQFTYPSLVSNALEGVHVLFDGVPAPITYAGAGQVNAVVPYAVAGKSATQLQVEYLGAVTAPVSLPVTAVSPGIFTAAAGTGQAAIVNIADFTVNSATNPAARGAYVSIYGTGLGVTTPAGTDGMLAATPFGQANPNLTVTVTMGGSVCQTNYVGAAPGLIAGALQINAQVPAGVTPGPSVPLVVSIGGVPSRPGVTLAVK
jgi:uncharacterized protein (TIGR03437 family)